jgi:hypothetical protein
MIQWSGVCVCVCVCIERGRERDGVGDKKLKWCVGCERATSRAGGRREKRQREGFDLR